MSRGASTAIRASDGTLAAALNPPKVVVLSGPTSVGKTEASLRLAKLLDCEIISADSVQVYRGLDVGSDKIPVEKRGGIPHHLIDIFDPYTEEFSAGSFYNHAHKAVAEILARGKTPLVVGGTGFYLKMFMDGKPSAEAATPEVVQEVENRLDQAFRAAETEEGAALDDAKRWAVGLQQLVALGDPAAAERIRGERNNWYRLKRAMEVLLMTGRPRADALLPAAQVRPADAERVRQLDFRCFYLHRPRAQIFERILLRTEHMVCAGLLQEAADLLQNGMQAGSRAAARAIGYRQALKYLTEVCEGGAAPEAGHLQQLVLDIATASRRLVKNQLTWFRDDEQYLWVDAEAGPEAVAAHIAQQVQLERHQGGCGNSGRLSKEEQYTSMVYQPELKILNQPEQLQLVLQQVAELKQRLAHSKQSTSSTASSD